MIRIATPSCGFHYGVKFEDYQAWDAVNISTLKVMRRTALHCQWAKLHPRERTDEMDIGSALHVSLLEPARFEAEFYLAPEYDGRTKEGKEVAERCKAEAAGRAIIRRKCGDSVDADDLLGMRESVRSHPGAKRLLDMPGQCEVSALWQDPQTGIICKGRFDKLTNSPAVIVEVKTTRDAAEWSFGRDAAKLGYAAQAAFYRWGHKMLTGKESLHAFLAVENKGPWAPALYCLGPTEFQTGEIEFRRWLDGYAECLKSGRWPGYSDRIESLSLPAWANEQTYE